MGPNEINGILKELHIKDKDLSEIMIIDNLVKVREIQRESMKAWLRQRGDKGFINYYKDFDFLS